VTLGAFGGVAGFFAVFFFSDVPRVRKDIVTKIPIIGQHFIKEVPASDNVRYDFLSSGNRFAARTWEGGGYWWCWNEGTRRELLSCSPLLRT
jgi:hypothetical protein